MGLLCGAAGCGLALAPGAPAHAAAAGEGHDGPTEVGKFEGSGLLFRDVIVATAIPDPCISGVTIHMSNMRDSRWTVSKWFEDPSSASIAVTPGRAVASSLRTATHPPPARFTQIFGPSFSEPATRPSPR